MRHSRSISDLRADVAENCRALLMLAEREGLSVLVTETVRDAEYQRMLAEKGYAAKGAVTPSFHAEHAGLAFDICKNEAGHEYDDPAFFIRVGEIGKMLGFSWAEAADRSGGSPAYASPAEPSPVPANIRTWRIRGARS